MQLTNTDSHLTLSDDLLIAAGEEITEAIAKRIEDAGIETVEIRSVLTCESKRGTCVKCYGKNLATGYLVTIVSFNSGLTTSTLKQRNIQ